MRIRPYSDSDWAEWLRMSEALFPSGSLAETEAEMRSCLERADAAVFIAERDDGSSCGYVQVGARSIADGCTTSPVGYVEAWYVDSDVRRQGVGRALLEAAETWSRAQGYREIASDALIDNVVSQRAHLRTGYLEVDRVVTFRKTL